MSKGEAGLGEEEQEWVGEWGAGLWPYLMALSGWALNRSCHLNKDLKEGRELASRKHSRWKKQQSRGPTAEAGVLCWRDSKQTQVAAVGWPRGMTENPRALRLAWIFDKVGVYVVWEGFSQWARAEPWCLRL